MSCDSVAKEIMRGRAGYLVEHRGFKLMAIAARHRFETKQRVLELARETI
jgi:acetolactate synthase regulatory subunit